MKIEVTLKDPDGFHDAVDEAVKETLKTSGLPQDEQDALYEKRREKAWRAIGRWVEYQEYVTVVFDTDAGTASVKELP